jgi:hypothetical protein
MTPTFNLPNLKMNTELWNTDSPEALASVQEFLTRDTIAGLSFTFTFTEDGDAITGNGCLCQQTYEGVRWVDSYNDLKMVPDFFHIFGLIAQEFIITAYALSSAWNQITSYTEQQTVRVVLLPSGGVVLQSDDWKYELENSLSLLEKAINSETDTAFNAYLADNDFDTKLMANFLYEKDKNMTAHELVKLSKDLQKSVEEWKNLFNYPSSNVFFLTRVPMSTPLL